MPKRMSIQSFSEITCTPLDRPKFATVMNNTQQKFVLGDQIIYECFPDYEMEGISTLTCQENSDWIPKTTPKCTGKIQ